MTLCTDTMRRRWHNRSSRFPNTCLIVIGLFAISSCLPAHMVIDTEYQPAQIFTPIVPPPERLSLFLEPIRGFDELEWYRTNLHSWSLDKRPSLLVREALEGELPAMGIDVKDTDEDVKGRLKVSVRWFGPYGNSPVSAAVILAVSLYGPGHVSPTWHGKVEGGVLPKVVPIGKRNINKEINRAMNEALSKAVARLRWNAEFCQAIRFLSLYERDQGGSG
ncbi:MAG: hypothetical protein JRJ31_14755 [Deltaproteobacteria bacterium]|nr:hypothetical protein [Deltaproteobacteria bacterium]